MQEEEKAWWQSRAVWGVLIGIVAQIVRAWGGEIDETALLNLVTEAMTLIGLVLAWAGRVRAQAPINLRRVLPGVTLQGRG